MVEVKEEEEYVVKALLVGKPPRNKEEDPRPVELEGLVKTMGYQCVGIFTMTRLEVAPVYGMGKGKAAEIANRAKELMADCIIFDWEIEPTKQRNWEKLTNLPCFDRNEVILRIFAQRAQTKEAVLQVELAKLTYSLPRLSHTYGNMARQRGGSYGAKGSGETQLELDRRQIEEKIIQIKKELESVELNRATQRKQRERTALQSCALVGYTNAGKSSLLNALTGAEVFVEDELFATLDPTTRKLELPEGTSILITDTVGFISNLPHTLIKAFKSTLEEASRANLLLITVDSSDDNFFKQYKEVQKVLAEINADKIQQLVLLNKIDNVKDNVVRMAELKAAFPDAIYLSAKTQEGFEELLSKITENLLGKEENYIIPLERTDIEVLIRKNGTITKEEWLEDGIHLTARIQGTFDDEGKASSRTLALAAPYIIKK